MGEISKDLTNRSLVNDQVSVMVARRQTHCLHVPAGRSTLKATLESPMGIYVMDTDGSNQQKSH